MKEDAMPILKAINISNKRRAAKRPGLIRWVNKIINGRAQEGDYSASLHSSSLLDSDEIYIQDVFTKAGYSVSLDEAVGFIVLKWKPEKISETKKKA